MYSWLVSPGVEGYLTSKWSRVYPINIERVVGAGPVGAKNVKTPTLTGAKFLKAERLSPWTRMQRPEVLKNLPWDWLLIEQLLFFNWPCSSSYCRFVYRLLNIIYSFIPETSIVCSKAILWVHNKNLILKICAPNSDYWRFHRNVAKYWYFLHNFFSWVSYLWASQNCLNKILSYQVALRKRVIIVSLCLSCTIIETKLIVSKSTKL